MTLFTTAKPFVGDARRRQLNAIRSWKRLNPAIEVLLFGNAPGYEETAAAEGLVHIPDVPSSESGCPRIDAMFAIACERARYPVRGYLNCDIILMDDVLSAVQRLPFRPFLLVAQRWNLDLEHEIKYADSGWGARLRQEISQRGQLMDPLGIDMFIYRGDIWTGLPEMYVGRAGYDNFLIYWCRKKGIPVIDATTAITLVHQNHDYSHLRNGRQEVWFGPEAQQNITRAGGWDYLFSIEDADWELKDGLLRRNYCRRDSKRYAKAAGILGRDRLTKGPVVLREAWAEFRIRCGQRGRARCRLVAKFPLWLALRLAGHR